MTGMQYWINQDGVQAGPVSREELEKMNIGPATYVWRSGLADWVKIVDVPELADLITSRVAELPTPPELPAGGGDCATAEQEPQGVYEGNAVPSEDVRDEAAAEPVQTVWQQQVRSEDVPECPPTNLAWAVVSIVLCCVPVGIAALVLSLKVTSCYRAGDYAKAKRMSEWSAWLCILSIIMGLVWSPISVLIAMI